MELRRTAGLTFTAAVLAVAGTQAIAPTARAELPGSLIERPAQGECLQPAGAQEGAAVLQVPCDENNLYQRWVFTGWPIFQARNLGTNRCLDVGGARAANHQPIDVWTCNSISNENWDRPNIFEFRSRISGTSSHCLDAPDGSNASGLWLQLFECNNTEAQAWEAVDPVIH